MISATDLISKFQFALDNKWGYIWGTAGVKWTAAKQEELNKTTDSDRALSREYGKKWIGHYVADCSGLFSWAFKQLGGQMYHGSNTMYLKWCADKGQLENGKRTDGKTLKPGTAVFVWNGKTYSHVGLYIGGDTVIEAQGTKAGVVVSKVSATKWKFWGELTGVDYSGDVQPVNPDTSKPMLKRGSKGVYVNLLQTQLVNRGYDIGKTGVDGDFGKCTEAAVKAFQEDCGLKVDGVVGADTWKALDDNPSGALVTVHIPKLPEMQAKGLLERYPGAYMTKDGD